MASVKARMARRRRTYDRVTIIALAVFLLFAGVTSVLAVVWTVRYFSADSRAKRAESRPVVSARNEAQEETNSLPVPTGPLQNDNDPTPVPWDGGSRITILVMGLDERDGDENDIPRTDTMILFSLDPASKTAGMLSIPRDLWVEIPEIGHNKINTAYRWGEVYELPGGGPALAMKTVEQFLGEPVHFYAHVDFMAFVRFIDELGGLTMHIREEITVDPVGPRNTKTLQPGVQKLDGATVLAYARMRYTEGGDFDRSARQQEVILALRDQILSLNQLPNLIIKAPRLYNQLSSGLRTNLTLQQIIQLARIASQVDEGQIRRGIISPPLQVEIATAYDGQSILLPVPEQIQILRDEVFSTQPLRVTAVPQNKPASTPTPLPTPTESVDPREVMQAENARVLIRNGTMVTGLASKTGEMLRSQGILIVGEDNANELQEKTTIYDYSGKPHTVRFLVEVLKISQSRVFSRSDPDSAADIEIILGEDWAAGQ
jgi:polyisoprenyl-teichoic acid--peptidoglycan teichoic acid transferase